MASPYKSYKSYSCHFSFRYIPSGDSVLTSIFCPGISLALQSPACLTGEPGGEHSWSGLRREGPTWGQRCNLPPCSSWLPSGVITPGHSGTVRQCVYTCVQSQRHRPPFEVIIDQTTSPSGQKPQTWVPLLLLQLFIHFATDLAHFFFGLLGMHCSGVHNYCML